MVQPPRPSAERSQVSDSRKQPPFADGVENGSNRLRAEPPVDRRGARTSHPRISALIASALMEEAEPTHVEQAWGMAIRRPLTPEYSFRVDRRMALGRSLPLLGARL
jgi:hypothetical protein